jgi:hypothetical protein
MKPPFAQYLAAAALAAAAAAAAQQPPGSPAPPAAPTEPAPSGGAAVNVAPPLPASAPPATVGTPAPTGAAPAGATPNGGRTVRPEVAAAANADLGDALAEFAAMDVDADGTLSQVEMRASAKYQTSSGSLDRSGDGRVSREEFLAGVRR